MASPCPVPFPDGLVVKNGVKIRLRNSSGDSPSGVGHAQLGPAIDPPGGDGLAPIPRRPCPLASLMAWAAFTRRLRTTWLNSPRCRGRGGRFGSSVHHQVGDVLPFVAAYGRRALDRLVQVRRALLLAPGVEKSFMAPTIFATRATPSSDCAIALGISAIR